MEHLKTRYFNARLVRDHQLQLGELWTAAGKIIPPQVSFDREVDVKGLILAPGYIDLQINGGFGVDFSSDPHRIQEVARHLVRHGVTAFLPTVISSAQKDYHTILPYLQPKIGGRHGASLLGIHLEGPFLCPQRHGAHNQEFIQPFPLSGSLEDFYGNLEGVKMITLAPERPGALKAIECLRQKKITVAAGHSSATYAQIESAVAHGVKMVSHLFNAMVPFHHREPGLVGFALTQPAVFYSLIVDGMHSHPCTIHLTWKAHSDRLVLISDAMAAAGLPSGCYSLGKQKVCVERGRVYVAGQTILAGSTLTLDAAVRHLYQQTQCSPVQALEAASLKPAEVLGMHHKKGTLTIGADADFLFLDDQLYVQASYIAGERVFSI